MNKGDMDIAVQGNSNFMNAIAGAQQAAAQMNQQRKMGIYGIKANARQGELDARADQMRAVQKKNPFMAALGVAAPFLGLIPGVGPALAAGAGAASSMG
jgi:biopolymer transport protein ExbB/TolQ